MALLATDAIVLHSFDYLESSRILRLVTRDGGVRSVLAKGARRSSRRFGTSLDLFAQGNAQLYSNPAAISTRWVRSTSCAPDPCWARTWAVLPARRRSPS